MLANPHICSMTGIDGIQLQQVIAHSVDNPTRG